jgi:PAS domain S-box-containing protein
MTTLRIGWGIERQIGRLALFEIAFLIAYRLGMSFSKEFAAPFWFPDSVVLAALLVSRRRDWWLYLLGTVPIRLFLFAEPAVPFGYLLATFANDSLKDLLSAWLLNSLSSPLVWFESLRDFIRYFLIAVFLSPALSAFAGAATRIYAGAGVRLYFGDAFWVACRNWFLGDALASIILTPLLVIMITARRKAGIDIARLVEGFLAASGVMIAGYVAFQRGMSGFPPFLLYLPVPFLLWATVRFDPTGAPLSLLLISLFAILSTGAGRGPFHLQSPADSLLSMQLFLFCVSVPFMFLSVLITEQRRTDGALRESEQRFRSLVDAGPVMVWMSGPDGLCTFFNKPWLDFTGRSMAEQSGSRWAESVHAEDRENCVNEYLVAFHARESFTLEYRLLRHDGSYRWIVDHGVPRYSTDGSFLGYVGSCIDMTDRKEAETRLRQLNAQIIHAQEAERSRIAQELHDDLSQRIALLSMRLEIISRKYGVSAGLKNEVHQLQQSTADLGQDIARIAHQLHPGIVEKVGLLPSLRALCLQSNTAERAVEFVCDQELPPLATEPALSLYRIAQESLRNALTHSGASRITIEVSKKAATIQLSIKDNGRGFAIASVAASGLGLSGMAERMKNVGGTLNILSHRGKGTTVIATVPIAKAMRATTN